MAVDQSEAGAGKEPGDGGDPPAGRTRRLAASTVFFSIATGFSRVAGLGREIIAASLFGVTGPMSAFTVAFQVPNLMAALFASAALQGAFVPVFSSLLEGGHRREALRVASSLFSLITVALGSLTILFYFAAPFVMGLVTPGFNHNPVLRHLTIELSRIMFPVVLLLALAGIVVGMLNSLGAFGVPALSPVVWNLVIIGFLVGVTPLFHGGDRVYAYAIGLLVGTVIQFALPLPLLRKKGAMFSLSFNWRNEHVIRILKLMLPVTIALGLINFDAVINSVFGTLVHVRGARAAAPAAIDKAFRIYMLPQGIFSVAIATILFPTLSRLAARGATADLRRTMANGTRLILLTLIPSAVIMAVLAVPITRLVYQRGEFNATATHLVSVAMLWWSLSLPAQGASLLFTRTSFSLQRPALTTWLAIANLIVNIAVSFALYKPFGVAGIVIGSVAGTLVMALAQAAFLRRTLGGIEGRKTLSVIVRILVASAALGGVSYVVWFALDGALGRSLLAQIVSLSVGIGSGVAVFAVAVLALRVDEAHQIRGLVRGRLRGGKAA